MGQSLEQILTQVNDGDKLHVSIVSNQANGIASYAVGHLFFQKATGGLIFGGPRFRPPRLKSDPSQPLQMFFSDRKLSIDPPMEGETFGVGPRQPFNANETEQLGVSISISSNSHALQLSVFGSKSLVILNPLGELLVGLGPSLGNSSGGVFVVAFLGVTQPPR